MLQWGFNYPKAPTVLPLNQEQLNLCDDMGLRAMMSDCTDYMTTQMEFIKVDYPDMRINLIAYTESLSNLEYQRQYWGKINPENPNFYDDFDESIHFLYDLTDIATDPKSWLGLALKNDKEVILVTALDEGIETLFQKHGYELTDEQYMTTEEWCSILDGAKTLYSELKLKDTD